MKSLAGSLDNAKQFMDQIYPDEIHNAGGDCINPQCNYSFTQGDEDTITNQSGWFDCPQCDYHYNYLDPSYGEYGKPGGRSRSGLTNTEMGDIGERIVERMGTVPGVGQVIEMTDDYKHPIDAIVGHYGVEIKTNHSEAQPRFKITGRVYYKGIFLPARKAKILYCQENKLQPGLIGVRLNFYTNKADVFFRPGMTDTWIGNPSLQHIGTIDFRDINPFPHPEDVPPAAQLPQDDSDPDSDIPF